MIGTFFASLAVLAYVVINILKHKGKNRSETVTQTKAKGYISAVLSGVIASNGLYHFIHGIFDYRDFPAPFALMMGGGIISDISNIIWGVFNLTLSLILIKRHRKSKAINGWQFVLFFLLGFVAISLLLRFVFLENYFKVYSF